MSPSKLKHPPCLTPMASSFERMAGILPTLITSDISSLSPFVHSVPDCCKLDPPERSLPHGHSNHNTLPVPTILKPTLHGPTTSVASTHENHLASLTRQIAMLKKELELVLADKTKNQNIAPSMRKVVEKPGFSFPTPLSGESTNSTLAIQAIEENDNPYF